MSCVARRKWIAHKLITRGIIIIIMIFFFIFHFEKCRNLCVTRLRFVMHVSLSFSLKWKVHLTPSPRLAHVVAAVIAAVTAAAASALISFICFFVTLIVRFFHRPRCFLLLLSLQMWFAQCHWQRMPFARCVCIYLYI